MKEKVDRRTLRTWVVVGVFAVLLAYVLLVESKRDTPPAEDATPTPYPILQYDLGEITGVRITDGQQTLRLAYVDGGWQIVESPAGQEAGPADPSTVSISIIQLGELAAKEQVIAQVDDGTTYGLSPQALTIAAQTATGEQNEIHVGRRTPDGTSFYVQKSGEPALYIVASYKLEAFFDWLINPPFQPTPVPDAQ